LMTRMRERDMMCLKENQRCHISGDLATLAI
jgi:hypothetical protein